MDESAFRAARAEINRLPCVFEKALLCRCAVCELSAPRAMAERETIACTSPVARANCGTLYGLLRANSAFALHLKRVEGPLTHGVAMKIQCGGLMGLQRVVDPEAPAPDVHRLVVAGRERFGAIEDFPFSEIVQGVAAWTGRRRRPPRGEG